MLVTSLSQDTKEFIDKHIRSVEDLEILLLLRAHPRQEWDAVEVARQLGLEPIAASNHLMALYLAGLIGHQESGGRLFQYRYATLPKLKDQRLTELAEVYLRSRVEVIEYIVTSQRRQLDAFAEAFQVKRKKKGG